LRLLDQRKLLLGAQQLAFEPVAFLGQLSDHLLECSDAIRPELFEQLSVAFVTSEELIALGLERGRLGQKPVTVRFETGPLSAELGQARLQTVFLEERILHIGLDHGGFGDQARALVEPLLARFEQLIALSADRVALFAHRFAVGCQPPDVGFQGGELRFALGLALELILQLAAFFAQQIALLGDLFRAGLEIGALLGELAQGFRHGQRAALEPQRLKLGLDVLEFLANRVALGGQTGFVLAELREHIAQGLRHRLVARGANVV